MSLTPEQLRLRLLGYGASEVPTIVGAGFGSIEELWLSKVKPEAERAGETLASELGNVLEDPIAEIYAKKTDRQLARVSTLVHPTRKLAMATPDRAVFTANAPSSIITDVAQLRMAERLAEVKTTAMRYRLEYGADGSSDVPEEKAIQVTWQMGVTGVPLADVVVLFIGEWSKSLEVFPISYSSRFFDLLYEAVAQFDRDYVKANKPPPQNLGANRYEDFLRRYFPRDMRPARQAEPEEEQLLMLYAKLEEAGKRLKTARNTTRQKLIMAIGEAAGLQSETLGGVTFKRTRDGSEVDWQKVAEQALRLSSLVINAMPDGERRHELERLQRKIVPDATKAKPGYRRLVGRWKGDAAFELAKLNLTFDALQSQTEGDNDDD